jgi:ribosomal protein L32
VTGGHHLPGAPRDGGRSTAAVSWGAPDLPVYEEGAPCKACGHYEVATKFCRGVVMQPHPDWMPWVLRLFWPTHRGPCRFDERARPHLHRTCERCGYVRAERVITEELEVPEP